MSRHGKAIGQIIQRIGATRLGVWAINFERPNPWTLNLRANPIAQRQIGSELRANRALEASAEQIERYGRQ